MMKCEKCGRIYQNGEKFCTECGGKIIYSPNEQQYGIPPQNISFEPINKLEKNNLAYIGLAFMLGSLLIVCMNMILGFIFALVAFVCGICSLNQKYEKKNAASAVTIILSAIVLIISFFALVFSGSSNSNIQNEDSAESGGNELVSDSESTFSSELATENSESIISREDFIASCQDFDYKTIARNPDEHIGEHYKVTVQIYSVMSSPWYADCDVYYKAFTDDGSGFYFDKMIWIMDYQDTDSDSYLKILEDDVVTVYGVFNGMTETENSITGESGEDVALDIYYADLISE